MSLKPLGKVRELVESAGMAISYAYDDLVFLDHNAFLLQFDEDGRTVFIHTNSEVDIGKTSEVFPACKKPPRQLMILLWLMAFSTP
jgi:hypothetical protein